MFDRLNLPPFSITIGRDESGNPTLYDPIRRKYVSATPEEWVRQHFVNYLVEFLKFPASFISNEKGLNFNGMRRRCDTIVFTRNLKPLCVVEYKRPSVDITPSVFDQIARYNSVFEAPYLIVSNGLKHFCCRFTGSGYEFLASIPSYDEMIK